MKTIGEIMNEIEHIPKCPKNGEVNLLYLIEIIKTILKNKINRNILPKINIYYSICPK